MIYLFANRSGHEQFCRRNDIDPRGTSKIHWIRTERQVQGLRPEKNDKIVLEHGGDWDLYRHLKGRAKL